MEPFKVAIVVLAAFFPVALATFDGMRGVPRAWFEGGARVFRTRLPDLDLAHPRCPPPCRRC